MTNDGDLWGDLPTADSVKAPVSVLKEQAAALTKRTNGVLQGEVRTFREGDQIRSLLEIVAPSLDGYRYAVASISHGIGFYPLLFASPFMSGSAMLNDEAAFITTLRDALQSDGAKRVVAGLLAQSKTGW